MECDVKPEDKSWQVWDRVILRRPMFSRNSSNTITRDPNDFRIVRIICTEQIKLPIGTQGRIISANNGSVKVQFIISGRVLHFDFINPQHFLEKYHINN